MQANKKPGYDAGQTFLTKVFGPASYNFHYSGAAGSWQDEKNLNLAAHQPTAKRKSSAPANLLLVGVNQTRVERIGEVKFDAALDERDEHNEAGAVHVDGLPQPVHDQPLVLIQPEDTLFGDASYDKRQRINGMSQRLTGAACLPVSGACITCIVHEKPSRRMSLTVLK